MNLTKLRKTKKWTKKNNIYNTYEKSLESPPGFFVFLYILYCRRIIFRHRSGTLHIRIIVRAFVLRRQRRSIKPKLSATPIKLSKTLKSRSIRLKQDFLRYENKPAPTFTPCFSRGRFGERARFIFSAILYLDLALTT